MESLANADIRLRRAYDSANTPANAGVFSAQAVRRLERSRELLSHGTLTVAQKQGSRGFELRRAVSLARLLFTEEVDTQISGRQRRY
jgi:hypothetical protein